MMSDLRCSAPDYSLPQFPPMTCGFPAVFTTTTADGTTVGLRSSCGAAAVLSGYVLTPIVEATR